MKFNLLLLLILPLTGFSQVTGTWHTSFIVMGMSKRLDLNVEITPKDTSGWIKDPEMKSGTKIPLDIVRVHSDSLHFTWTAGRLNLSQMDTISE